MRKLKIMSVVGTRPEIIRLSRVLAALDEYCDYVNLQMHVKAFLSDSGTINEESLILNFRERKSAPHRSQLYRLCESGSLEEVLSTP